VGQPAPVSTRVVTVPNALSLLRLLCVPLFLWLVLGPRADGWALGVLAVSGVSDYLDGRIARAFGQTSRLGQVLDPLADRLAILATVVALALRDVIPVALALGLAARDVVLAGTLPVLRRHGYGPLPVHFLGKAATFNLLYAFPLLLLGDGSGIVADTARVLGWAFAGWGSALYWWAGVLYLVQVRRLVLADRRCPPEPPEGRVTDPKEAMA
jgi:cardiolipin synthase